MKGALRVCERKRLDSGMDWRARAAEWLRDVAEIADAEGLTPPEIIEDRLKLANLLSAEAAKETKL